MAADAEISRASLNVHLDKLEMAGLIRRHRRHSEGTHRRKSTRYILGFETDFERDPCPESGHGKPQKPCPDFAKSHVQNLDTNLVREPVTTTAREADENADAQAACLAASGEGLSTALRTAITATRPVIDAWLAAGYDLNADILPTLAERTKRKRADPIRTWGYFTMAIAKRHTQRVAPAATAKSAEKAKAAAKASPAEILAFTADWINSGKYVPPSAVSNTMRDALLAAGLVTEAALRARQLY